MAVRDDRLDLGLFKRGATRPETAALSAQPAAVRVALRRPDGHVGAGDLLERKSNASFSTTTRACAGAISARQAPSSARSSAASA